jgi:hypothetical protein
MPDVHFDLNALCIGDLTKTETDCILESNIYVLPDSFVTEAEALGARITETRGGFPVPRHPAEGFRPLLGAPFRRRTSDFLPLAADKRGRSGGDS